MVKDILDVPNNSAQELTNGDEMQAVVVLLGVLVFFTSEHGHALAQVADGNRLQAFTRTDFYKGLTNRALATIPQTVFEKCPTLVSDGSTVTIIRPVSFGASGFPNAGLRRQSFPIRGCGNDTVLNIYFSVGADEKVNTVVGFPGTTRADLILQRDASLYAKMGAARVAKDCKAFEVKNTKFEAFGVANPPIRDPGPENHFRPWWETWTMIGCDRRIDVPIDFIPDEKGTRIVQPPGAVER